MLETITIRVSPAKKARLRELAKARGETLSHLANEVLDKVLESAPPPAHDDAQGLSCYDAMKDVLEMIEAENENAPADLSTNKAYLRNLGATRRPAPVPTS